MSISEIGSIFGRSCRIGSFARLDSLGFIGPLPIVTVGIIILFPFCAVSYALCTSRLLLEHRPLEISVPNSDHNLIIVEEIHAA